MPGVLWSVGDPLEPPAGAQIRSTANRSSDAGTTILAISAIASSGFRAPGPMGPRPGKQVHLSSRLLGLEPRSPFSVRQTSPFDGGAETTADQIEEQFGSRKVPIGRVGPLPATPSSRPGTRSVTIRLCGTAPLMSEHPAKTPGRGSRGASPLVVRIGPPGWPSRRRRIRATSQGSTDARRDLVPHSGRHFAVEPAVPVVDSPTARHGPPEPPCAPSGDAGAPRASTRRAGTRRLRRSRGPTPDARIGWSRPPPGSVR